MKRSSSSRLVFAAFVVAIVLFLAPSCTVPLAPGYQILKQTFDVNFVSNPSPEIRVHNVYTLRNSGTAPLDFIDVVFPDEKLYGRTSLHVALDGRAVEPASLPAEYQPGSPGAVRLSSGSSWPQKDSRELVVDYTLAALGSSGVNFALTAENFFLGTQGWLPVFLPPNHILASAPVRPDKMEYTVCLPNDFMVLARGSSAGRKQNGADTTYRFALNKDDLAPYVVAGRYSASSGSAKSEAAIFWTSQLLPASAAAAAQRFAAAWTTLQKNFGQLDKRATVPYIVEAPALTSPTSGTSTSAFAGFPGGVLVNSAALALGTDNREFVESVERSLAITWFGDAMRPAPAASIALGEGLPAYAAVVIDEASGGSDARTKDIAGLLHDYDQGRQPKNVPEKSVLATLATDPLEQRRAARAKAALLFVALEDAYGPTPVRAGLAQAVQLLRGKDVTVNDVRAAIEFTTKANLAEPFRAWLYNPGIPAAFRARYGPPAENQK
ncbi:MAG TPA: hypothetical protein VGD60_09235 [Candidatus Acidoferrales bacterium]